MGRRSYKEMCSPEYCNLSEMDDKGERTMNQQPARTISYIPPNHANKRVSRFGLFSSVGGLTFSER